MAHPSHNRGNTVVEVLVTLALVALAVAIWMATRDNGPRINSSRVRNSTQISGIIKCLTIYATYQPDQQFPGVDGEGIVVSIDTAARFFPLVSQDSDPLDPRLLVNPVDTGTTVWDGRSTFTAANYSYALLDISEPGHRRTRWANESNASTPLVADRNTATDGTSTASLWNPTSWEGSVGWGDGHVTFENTPVLDTSMSSDDHLFAGGPDDAWLRHSMEEQRVKP